MSYHGDGVSGPAFASVTQPGVRACKAQHPLLLNRNLSPSLGAGPMPIIGVHGQLCPAQLSSRTAPSEPLAAQACWQLAFNSCPPQPGRVSSPYCEPLFSPRSWEGSQTLLTSIPTFSSLALFIYSPPFPQSLMLGASWGYCHVWRRGGSLLPASCCGCGTAWGCCKPCPWGLRDHLSPPWSLCLQPM